MNWNDDTVVRLALYKNEGWQVDGLTGRESSTFLYELKGGYSNPILSVEPGENPRFWGLETFDGINNRGLRMMGKSRNRSVILLNAILLN